MPEMKRGCAGANGCLVVREEGCGAGEGGGDFVGRVGHAEVADGCGRCAGARKDGKNGAAAVADGDRKWDVDRAGGGEDDGVDVALGEEVVGGVRGESEGWRWG